MELNYVKTAPTVTPLDGLVQIRVHESDHACIMPRRAALAFGRALFLAVKTLEDAEAGSRPALLSCHGCERA